MHACITHDLNVNILQMWLSRFEHLCAERNSKGCVMFAGRVKKRVNLNDGGFFDMSYILRLSSTAIFRPHKSTDPQVAF